MSVPLCGHNPKTPGPTLGDVIKHPEFYPQQAARRRKMLEEMAAAMKPSMALELLGKPLMLAPTVGIVVGNLPAGVPIGYRLVAEALPPTNALAGILGVMKLPIMGLSIFMPPIKVPQIWLPHTTRLFDWAIEEARALLLDLDTFFGDVFIVAGRREGDQEAALDRLTRGDFSKGNVFHPNRWSLIEPRFWEYQQVYGSNPWQHLVASALQIAYSRIEDTPEGRSYQWLHNETRKEIERALFDGETLDEHLGRQGQRLVWLPDSPEMLAREAEVAAELAQIREIRLEAHEILSNLGPKDRELAEFIADGYALVDIAKLWGVQPEAVRKRWQRLRERLIVNCGKMSRF